MRMHESTPPKAFDDVEERQHAACDLYGCFIELVCFDVDLLPPVSLRDHLMHIKPTSECVRVNFESAAFKSHSSTNYAGTRPRAHSHNAVEEVSFGPVSALLPELV